MKVIRRLSVTEAVRDEGGRETPNMRRADDRESAEGHEGQSESGCEMKPSEKPNPALRGITKCPLCNGMVTVHCILCCRCERAACVAHFVFDPGFEWLCPVCIEVLGGEVQ